MTIAVRCLIAVVLFAALAACGNKGPLVKASQLPPAASAPPSSAPAEGTVPEATAPPPTPPAGDGGGRR